MNTITTHPWGCLGGVIADATEAAAVTFLVGTGVSTVLKDVLPGPESLEPKLGLNATTGEVTQGIKQTRTGANTATKVRPSLKTGEVAESGIEFGVELDQGSGAIALDASIDKEYTGKIGLRVGNTKFSLSTNGNFITEQFTSAGKSNSLTGGLSYDFKNEEVETKLGLSGTFDKEITLKTSKADLIANSKAAVKSLAQPVKAWYNQTFVSPWQNYQTPWPASSK